MCDPAVETVVFMSGAQDRKTELLLNAIGFYICHEPSPILVLQPSLSLGQAFLKDRLAPMIHDSEVLVDPVQDARSRDANNTKLQKGFPGGHITIAGSNSPASLASRSIRICLADEIDRCPACAGSEGDLMYIPSDEMLDWMPVMLSEDEARELLGEEDLDGKLV